MSLCTSVSQRCRARLVLKVLLLLASIEILFLLVPLQWQYLNPRRFLSRDAASASDGHDADSQEASAFGALRPDSPLALLQSALNSALSAARAIVVHLPASSNDSLLERSANQSAGGIDGGSQDEAVWPELWRDPCALGHCELPLCERDARFGKAIYEFSHV